MLFLRFTLASIVNAKPNTKTLANTTQGSFRTWHALLIEDQEDLVSSQC
jgi:hypothetical protein